MKKRKDTEQVANLGKPCGSGATTGCTAGGADMRHYLSFGGGVNSVALYLLMEQFGMDFEAIFVDHGGDWPETYEYVDYFIATGRPVTILRPEVNTIEKVKYDNIVKYCEAKKITPSRKSRMCTDRFKIVTVNKYKGKGTPCFMHIGYAAGEESRMALNGEDGAENRYILIEDGIDREGCKKIISDSGLKIPMKSGCYICPFQGISQFKELRMKHPELFCKAQKLEETQNGRYTKTGRKWKQYYLCGTPLRGIDRQKFLPGFEKYEYPPCQCGL